MKGESSRSFPGACQLQTTSAHAPSLLTFHSPRSLLRDPWTVAGLALLGVLTLLTLLLYRSAPQSVVDHAREIGADLWSFGRDFNFSGDKQQWSWAGRGRRYAGLAYPSLRGANQLVNASGVLAAFEALRDRLPVTAQAVRNGMAMVELPGRFQIVPGQPTLVLDVAHNPHSVAALTANLDAMGYFPVTHAVFGAMADKDLAPMLAKVGPLVDRWYFTDLPTPRAESAAVLQQKWNAVHMVAGGRRDVASSLHADPLQALQAAVAAADPADRIVVFGSFYTVGGVLINGTPRLHAKHMGA